MRSFVPLPGDRRARARRLTHALAVLLLAAGIAAQPASGAAVQPKATPLAIVATGAPARCPSTSEVDGRSVTAIMRRALRAERGADFLAFGLFAVLPTPALVLCDPELAGTAQPLGAFAGATHYPLSADVAFSGTRALGTPPEGLTDSELVPGDRVELPSSGPRSVLSVMVATNHGAKVQQIGPLGSPRATAVRIEGALSAPVVVVEREGADPTRTAVTPPSAVATRVRPDLRGRDIVFSGTAAPGTIVFAGAGNDASDPVITATSGRFAAVKVRVGPKRRNITVNLLNLSRRQGFEVTCKARWNQARRLADKVTCKGVRAASAARATRQAKRSAVAAAAAPTSDARRTVVTPHAARALTTVEATVTGLTKYKELEFPTLAGDLNGDGRPDAIVSSFRAKATPRLIISQGGEPASIPLRIDDGFFDSVTHSVPDLDGDGRDELDPGAGVIVTDALAAPTLPKLVDLRSLRPTSPRDLDLGLVNRESTLSDILTATDAQGSIADTTGDGRPEISLGGDGLGAIFPSQAVVPGIRSRLAQIFPIAWLDDVTLEDLSSGSSFGGTRSLDLQAQGAIENAGTVTIGGRLIALSPADPKATPAQPRTLLLRTYGGGPVPLATTSFTAAGIPLLLDHDPASGDFLVALFEKRSCGRKRCLDRLLRVNPAGQLVSVVALRRDEGELFARFIADGPDADAAVDVAVARHDPLVDPSSQFAGKGGTIAILASSQTGSRALAALPVLARGGEPLVSPLPIEVSVLPSGSRWMAATTNVSRSGTGTYVLLGQKP